MADTSHRVDVELSGVVCHPVYHHATHQRIRAEACMHAVAVPRPLSVGLLVILSIGLLCGSILATDPMRRFCVEEGQCLTPASYLTMMITVVVLLALCNDAPPDLTLLAATVLLSVLPGPMEGSTRWRTLISPRQAWELLLAVDFGNRRPLCLRSRDRGDARGRDRRSPSARQASQPHQRRAATLRADSRLLSLSQQHADRCHAHLGDRGVVCARIALAVRAAHAIVLRQHSRRHDHSHWYLDESGPQRAD